MPEIEPDQDERDELELEEAEKEESLILRREEKPKRNREEVLQARIRELNQKVDELSRQLQGRKRSTMASNLTRGSRLSLADSGGLLTTNRRSSSRIWTAKINELEERKKDPSDGRGKKQHVLPLIEEDDPEVERLMAKSKDGLTSLAPLPVEKRKAGDNKRSGFRVLMEAKEDNSVSIVRVNEGYFSLPSLTRLQLKLKFIKDPKKVLIIKKPGDIETKRVMENIIRFLNGRKIQVICETSVESEVELGPKTTRPLFLQPPDIRQAEIDFIICLGGDGTILWACGLFPQGIPPIVSFKMGSLGFLTPFPAEHDLKVLREILKKDKEVTVRARLEVSVLRRRGQAIEKTQVLSCLNEVVAKHPQNMVSLDVYNNDKKLTTVFADGVILATPTGSTAYSLSCGGSMVHPAIPAMVLTPIAPHTLSFRPIVFPDSSTIRLEVPPTARSEVFVNLDGRSPITLNRGDAVTVTVSHFPVAVYCNMKESEEWFKSIKDSFLWNMRTPQKSM